MEQLGTNIFVETVYPGVNVGCLITDEGSICIDTPLLPGEAQRWRARIRSLGGEPVRFVVYTSGQRERILGARYLVDLSQGQPASDKSGSKNGKGTIVSHNAAWEEVLSHQNDNFKQSMVDLFVDRDPDIVDLEVRLPEITFDDTAKLYLGDQEVTLWGPASGMVWLWIAEEQVLFAGDTVVVGSHPPLTVTDTLEWLSALARLRREKRFKDATIVPGRGPLTDISATRPLTDFIGMARDRTRRIFRAGRPKSDLNKVAAALLPLYPIVDGQKERVQRQLKLALDDLYDHFKALEAPEE
jgi:glyoxylase-like metal-dependent hydrolase (beta-lactamase superfamily II)